MNDENWQASACILCECNCGIQVELGGDDGRRLARVRGDKAHPSSRGYACEKAQRLDYYQNDRDRLLWPQRRRADGTFERIDWDTAIREVAERLATVRDEHGGSSIFYYGGGGQGNHLPGVYASSTRRALGARYRSNALAQEKTGEFWVSERMLGTYTRSDFENCQVGMFLGKNPWQSHSIHRARVTLREIARDPDRTLIVVDPRRTESAELADIHLQVRPGADAWLLAALLGVLVDEDLIDHAFVDEHTVGLSEVRPLLESIDIPGFCARAGVEEALVRRAARAIGTAESVASFEDLGVQMNRNSTLVSYLHRLLWLLTGNFAKPGTQYVPTPLLALAGASSGKVTPVTGARIISGMVPCNAIADEILTDHPDRFRAMIVEAANPVHSLADSQRMREAMSALDTLVVIDVAMTETAQLADYVLPAATQYEKAEATFFNLEFPENYFHLRPRLLTPPEGPLPEAEIHARLCEALGALTDEDVAPFHEAAALGREAYAAAFMERVFADPRLGHMAPVLLYRTLGPTLPDELAEGAVVYGLAYRCAFASSQSLARAGFDGAPGEAAEKLFDAILDHPSGVVFAIDAWDEVRSRVATPSDKIELALDDLLGDLRALSDDEPEADPAFPYVLSAGERRSFTANTILRNPAWRKKDQAGALRINPDDAAALQVSSGGRVKVTTRRGSAVVTVDVSDRMQRGHVSLPNGMGIGGDGDSAGVAPNELTHAGDRDPYAGTPWHKAVPARIERLDGA